MSYENERDRSKRCRDQLQEELVRRAKELDRARQGLASVQRRMMIRECIADAERLTATLTELAQWHESSDLDRDQAHLINCRRAISAALAWVGVYPGSR